MYRINLWRFVVFRILWDIYLHIKIRYEQVKIKFSANVSAKIP